MPSSRTARALLVISLALGTVAACSGSGDDDAAPTTRATTTTTEADTRTPRTVPDELPGLDCDTVAEDGPPKGSGADDVPSEPVTFATGQAVVLLTQADGTESCLDLQLSPLGARQREGQLDPGERSLDLRWEDGGLAFQIGVTSTTIAKGPIDSFTRVESNDQVWGDSMHTECEVRLDGVDATSVDGSVTCEALSSFSGGDPVAVVAAFHVET